MPKNLRIAFYFACLLGWVVFGIVPAMRAYSKEDTRVTDNFYEKLDLLTPAEINSELENMRSEAVANNPEVYFDRLQRIGELRLIARKGDLISTGQTQRAYRSIGGREWSDTAGQLQKAYSEKFDGDTMVNTSKRWTTKHAGMGSLDQRVSTANIFPFIKWAYIVSLPFMLLFFLARLDANGFSPLVEMLAPWRLALAVLCWPIGLFKYPNGEPARQMVHALRFATFMLGTCLSGFTGTAVAQTTSPSKEKRKDEPHTLQMDFRVAPFGDGVPDLLGRTTFISPKGVFSETIATTKPDRWNLSSVIGPRIVNHPTLKGYFVAGLARNSAQATTALAGTQFFWNKPRFSLLLPLMSYERRLDKPTASAAIGGFAFAKTKNWRAGTEFAVRKPLGSKTFWSFAPLLARNVSSGFVEAAVIHNSQDEWKIRGRFVHIFTW